MFKATHKNLKAFWSAIKIAFAIIEARQLHPEKLTVYVSGPMRGFPDFNFPAFHAAAARLREAGFIVFSPAEMGDNVGWTWHDYMIRDLVCAALCDGIAMLRGWEGSKGAKAEKAVMEATGGWVGYYDENYSREPFSYVGHENELGRLDVTFTVVTRDGANNPIAAPALAEWAGSSIVDSARDAYAAQGRRQHEPGMKLGLMDGFSVFATIEGPVIHSSAATAQQGFTGGILGLESHRGEEVANG